MKSFPKPARIKHTIRKTKNNVHVILNKLFPIFYLPLINLEIIYTSKDNKKREITMLMIGMLKITKGEKPFNIENGIVNIAFNREEKAIKELS